MSCTTVLSFPVSDLHCSLRGLISAVSMSEVLALRRLEKDEEKEEQWDGEIDLESTQCPGNNRARNVSTWVLNMRSTMALHLNKLTFRTCVS